MRQAGRECSKTELGAGIVILLLLGFIGVGVFLRQYTFNPAVLVARNLGPQPAATRPAAPGEDALALPPGLEALSTPETFNPGNLYDKIDGKAELYVSAGFVELHCQRFKLKDAPDQWFEWFVYDMGNLPQAFSVFSTQRRAEAQPLDLTEFAYRTRNALYFVCGRNYVEAIASSPADPLMSAMRALASRFVAANPPGASRLPEMAILSADNLVPGSSELQVSDAFGFDRFKNVFTAQYKVGESSIMGFVTSCSNAETATRLNDAYRAFLIENGGKAVPLPPDTGLGQAVEIMGGIEIIFCRGNFVAGVHSAPALAPAEQLAAQLQARLPQRVK